LVVGTEVVDQLHAFNRVALSVEFAEYLDQVVGDSFVAYHLAYADVAVAVVVGQEEVAQIGPWDSAIGGVGQSTHALLGAFRNFFGAEQGEKRFGVG
jgi:3-oxoacyl-[acyl-carrier-protein] synthase III